ncbi:MAG: universal stress protein [Bacteroidales bacterium]|nr:universal stress protein [Bacteroidales bacterium]
MKTIIVPVDFSSESIHGLEMALLFGRKDNVNIQMVYVQKRSQDYRPGTYEEEHKYAENEFDKIIEKYSKDIASDSRLRFIIKKGKIYEEVVEQAESYKESTIIASTHGASGFEEYFIGSNAYKIITATKISVLTVRRRPPKTIKKVVAPLRLHVDTRQKVPFAADLAQLFGAELHLLAVNLTNNKKDQKRMKSYLQQSTSYLKRKGLKPIVKNLTGENSVSTVCNYCNAVDADIVTIMSSQRSSMAILMGSYSQQMIARSNCPVLSVNAKEKHIPAGFTTRGYR